MRRRIVLAVLLGTSVASAHIALKSPTARTNDQVQLKVGPCGQNVNMRTNNVTMFKPGQTITVSWDETINHPGHYRISFDPNGTKFPDPASFTDYDSGATDLVDNIPDKTGMAPIAYTQQVKLPNVECTNCTLQLIQVMTDKPPYGDGNDIYYQCADLVLNGDAGVIQDSGVPMMDSGSSGGMDATVGGDGGPEDPDGGKGGVFFDPNSKNGPGCSLSESAAPSGAWGGFGLSLLAMLGWLARRKKR